MNCETKKNCRNRCGLSSSSNDQIVQLKQGNCLECKVESSPQVSSEDDGLQECGKNWKQKAFVEALTRIAQPDESSHNMKNYQAQLRKNEELRDQLTRQKAVHMGVLLEGKAMQGKLEMQAKTTTTIQEKMKVKEEQLHELKCELGSIIGSNKQRKEEIDCELNALLEEKEKNRQDGNCQNTSQNTGAIEILGIEPEVIKLVDDLYRIKIANERKLLNIELLKKQKGHLLAQIKDLEERDHCYQEKLDKICQKLHDLDLEIDSNDQVIKNQETQISQLNGNICDEKKCGQNLRQYKLLVEQEKEGLQLTVQTTAQKMEATRSEQDGLRANIECLKSDVIQLRAGLQKDKLATQDAFAIKC